MTCLRSVSAILPISAALLVASPAVAQTRDHAPVDLQSTQMLAQDKSGSESWTYLNPAAVFTKYRTVIIEPGVVYDGPDAQFDGIDRADRAKYAQIMTTALQSEIGKSFPPPAKARADTIRVHLDLIGVQKTKGGIATATRVTPIGFGLSALKSIRGKQGTFTGSVLYAVEAYDGRTGELLLAAVRRRSPDPLDIPATLSTTDTVKAVARDFAVSARTKLESMTQVQAARQ
jgi:hypothetical protein